MNKAFAILIAVAVVPIFSNILLGIMGIQSYNSLSLGQVVRGMVLLIIFYYALVDFLSKKQSFSPAFYGVFFLGLVCVNIQTFGGQSSFFMSFSVLLKVLFTLGTTMLITYLLEKKGLSENQLFKAFRILMLVILAAHFFGVLTGFSEDRYKFSDYGVVGVFSSANDVSFGITMLIFILSYDCMNSGNRRSLLLIVFGMIALFTLASRTAIIGGVICLCPFYIRSMLFGKNRFWYLLMSLGVISAFAYFAFFVLLQDKYLLNKYLFLLSSEETAYLPARAWAFLGFLDIIQQQGLGYHLFGYGVGDFHTVLGQETGFRNSFTGELGKHAELDFVDLSGYFGFPFALWIFLFYVGVLRRLVRQFLLDRKNLFLISGILFLVYTLTMSNIAGHLMFSPMPSSIFACFTGWLIFQTRNRDTVSPDLSTETSD